MLGNVKVRAEWLAARLKTIKGNQTGPVGIHSGSHENRG